MDRDALYREVTEKHGGALARVAASYELDSERRRELLLGIHASVWKSLALFDQRLPLRTWVFRIAHNVGTAHLVRARGERLKHALDRQLLTLHREGLDALVIAEITGLSPSKVALALHRLEAAAQRPEALRTDLPTAFTLAELQDRGVEGVAGETSRFFERLLAERRSEQLFRLGAGAFLIPLLLLLRPAAQHSAWAVTAVVLLIGGLLLLVSRQLLALGATTRALTEARAPDLPPLPRRAGIGLLSALALVGLAGGVFVIIEFDGHDERQTTARKREQAVSSVARCLDPRANDPECVNVLGDRKPRLEAPIAQVPAAPDCRQRRRTLASSADLGSIELTLLEAIAFGEACPDELLLPAAVLEKDLLTDVTESARKACLGPDRALESCGLYARLACQGTSSAWRERNEAFLTFLRLRKQRDPNAEPWQCVDSPIVALLRAFSVATPDGVRLDSFEVDERLHTLSGYAVEHKQVFELARRLDDLVRTPSGLGRVVERDGRQVRVELLASADSLELSALDALPLFPHVDVSVKRADRAGRDEAARFKFELTLVLNREALPSGHEWTAPYAPDVMVAHFSGAVREGPENAEAWLSLGYARKAQNKPGAAVSAFRKYLELRPETPMRRELEDQIYFLEGR